MKDRRMRVIYYSRPCFLETSLHFVRALSSLAEVHFILEVSPESWMTAGFDVERTDLPDGLLPGAGLLERHFHRPAWEFWRSCASFQFAVHNAGQTLHPRTWNTSRKVLAAIRRLRPDVIHLDDRSLRLALALFGVGSVPVVLNIHDPFPHSGEPSNWRHRLSDALTLRHVARYVVFSEFTRQLFLKKFGGNPARVSVLRFGSLELIRNALPPDVNEEPRTVLFLGRISPYKGVENFLRSAAIVAGKERDVRFVIAGKPIDGMAMPRIPSLGGGCTVTVLDRYLNNIEAATLLQRASMVVCPYLDSTQSAVVLTAYGFDTPVIATTVGALPEYVWNDKTGILVPPGDDLAFADAIVSLLRNGPRRRAMKRAIQEMKNDVLGWDGAAHAAMEMYGSLPGLDFR